MSVSEAQVIPAVSNQPASPTGNNEGVKSDLRNDPQVQELLRGSGNRIKELEARISQYESRDMQEQGKFKELLEMKMQEVEQLRVKAQAGESLYSSLSQSIDSIISKITDEKAKKELAFALDGVENPLKKQEKAIEFLTRSIQQPAAPQPAAYPSAIRQVQQTNGNGANEAILKAIARAQGRVI